MCKTAEEKFLRVSSLKKQNEDLGDRNILNYCNMVVCEKQLLNEMLIRYFLERVSCVWSNVHSHHT